MSEHPRRHPHLVFIHGGGVGPWMWRHQQHHFREEATVHTPTMPGHDAAVGSTYISHADAARSIARQVDFTKLGVNVTVIGFSVGGQVAIEFASMFPEQVARTVVVSSLVTPWRAAALLAQTSAAAAPLAASRRFARLQAKQLYIPDEDFESYFALSSSMSKTSLTNMMRANFSFTPPQSFLTSEKPVLLVAGSKEQRSLVGGLTDLGSRLPVAQFESIDDVGHGAPIAKPTQFNRLLGTWLAEHAA